MASDWIASAVTAATSILLFALASKLVAANRKHKTLIYGSTFAVCIAAALLIGLLFRSFFQAPPT